ncbi:pilus assembly protein TadG-related protein [Candidatus Formimonas warabiya]|nr:pilus assembly protein TadG-related protein [Candidatus Formimonas warabiya]
MNKKIFDNEKGSAMILVALGMAVLLGLVSLVTDTGLIFVSQAKLVNAVDAAALAGAQELPGRPDLAVTVAENYAVTNGVNAHDLDIEVMNENKAIRVQAERNVNLLFAKILGINTGFVEHEATAQVGPIAATEGVVPLGIQEQELNFGEQYTLKVGAGESDTGWFGALALGGPGASTYEENLTYGYPEVISIGDILDVQTGNISNPTKRAIDFRLLACNHTPYCTVDHFQRDCARLVKIPIIEKINARDVKVVGFGVLLLDDVTGQGNDSYVKGRFVQTILPGEISGEAENFGVLGVKLIE